MKSKMETFLDEAFRPWSDFTDSSDDNLVCLLTRRCQIGFESELEGGSEWEYLLSTIRWMALQVGRRRRNFSAGRLPEPAPYYTVGGEAVPVLLSDDWIKIPEEFKQYVVDRYGLRKGPRTARQLAWYYLPNDAYSRVSVASVGQPGLDVRETLIQNGIERAKVTLQFIRAEMSSLDVLWETRSLRYSEGEAT
jgi:hypothetical protein